jgi:hypothetical protein
MRSHHHDAPHNRVHRDSKPPGNHDDGPPTRPDHHERSPRSTAKTVELLHHVIKKPNHGNPSPHEHDLICSHDGHHTSGHYKED